MTEAGRCGHPHTLDGLGYGVEWQVLNSKDFGVPQSRKRVYLVGYLDEKCRGKILPFTETAGTPLKQIRPGAQGERIYSTEGVSCTLTSQQAGWAGKPGCTAQAFPSKENTKKGYKMAYPGDSVDLAYPTSIPAAAGWAGKSPTPSPPGAAKAPFAVWI